MVRIHSRTPSWMIDMPCFAWHVFGMDYISKLVDVIEYQGDGEVTPIAILVDHHFIRIKRIHQIIRGLTSKSHDFGYCYDVILENDQPLRLFYRLSDHCWFVEVESRQIKKQPV